MEYIFKDNKIIIEMFYHRKLKNEMYYRLMIYWFSFMKILDYKKQKTDSENIQVIGFWDKESYLEKRIYKRMKKWEERHPIMGIIICTILLGILISLVAGVILEGIY